jgi:hypothetical protein
MIGLAVRLCRKTGRPWSFSVTSKTLPTASGTCSTAEGGATRRMGTGKCSGSFSSSKAPRRNPPEVLSYNSQTKRESTPNPLARPRSQRAT